MTFTDQYIQMMKESPINKGSWDEFSIKTTNAVVWKPKVGDWTYDTAYKCQTLITKPETLIGLQNYYIWLPTSDDWFRLLLPIFRPIIVDSEVHAIDEMFGAFTSFCFEGKTIAQWPWNQKDISILELLSAFWHNERGGLRWEKGEWRG